MTQDITTFSRFKNLTHEATLSFSNQKNLKKEFTHRDVLTLATLHNGGITLSTLYILDFREISRNC